MHSRNAIGLYLVVYQQFRSFKVPGGHSNVVFLVGMIEFCQTPVD